MASKRLQVLHPGYEDQLRSTYVPEDFRNEIARIRRETQIQQRKGA